MGYFALKFLFTQIYRKEWAREYLPTPRMAKTLPLVLSKDEVRDVLAAIPNFKHRTAIMFIYSTGTRVSECVNNEYGESYITRDNIKGQQKGIIRLLMACRSAAPGSHYEKCDACHYPSKAHNSCRNRHCPLCQHKDKLQWLEKRMSEMLPVGYYHLVFTIPHELNTLCMHNKKVMYDILFRAASQTVLELAKDPRHLGADTGLITILHTWGQNMKEHPHLHCIMPAGGLSFDREYWVHPHKKDDFFVYYKAISNKFRGKFLDLLFQAYLGGKLTFKGNISMLAAKKHFVSFKDRLYLNDWVVNIQTPFGSPEKVLEYLSRYVFRIAITNRRIIEVKNGKDFLRCVITESLPADTEKKRSKNPGNCPGRMNTIKNNRR